MLLLCTFGITPSVQFQKKKHAVFIVTKQRHFFLILFILSFKTTNIYISHGLFMMNSGCMIQHSAFFNMSSRPGFSNAV